MSALPSKADIPLGLGKVCFGPKADAAANFNRLKAAGTFGMAVRKEVVGMFLQHTQGCVVVCLTTLGREMHNRCYFGVGVLAVAFVVTSGLASAGEALAQQQPLTEAELREAIFGKSVHWSNNNITDYRADGTFTFSGSRTISGKWTLSGNKVCYTASTGSSACDQFYKDAKGLYNIDYNGKQFRFTVDGPAR